jgi:deoxyribodipyrimidine photolyase-related protein
MKAPFLIPILGDQLTPNISSLGDADHADSILLMMEVADETTYVRHHKAKIAYILSAMRHHADRMRKLGWTVDHVRLDDPAVSGGLCRRLCMGRDAQHPWNGAFR